MVMMDEDTFDLSHLTVRERERILAVINADQELRVQRLRYSSWIQETCTYSSVAVVRSLCESKYRDLCKDSVSSMLKTQIVAFQYYWVQCN